MKNVNKKELFIKLIPLFITLLSCIILVSYAYYKIKLEGQKTHFVSTDVISFTYKESEDKISITNMEPKSDTEGIKENYFEFNVASNLVKDITVIVPSGYYYRVRGYHAAKDGSKESTTTLTNGVLVK